MNPYKRILLVEDDSYDVELIMKALNEFCSSCSVDVTIDGVEALDYLYKRNAYAKREHGTPIAIFLDLQMPRLDGKQVLKIAKSDAHLKSIPIIMLATSQEMIDMNECYELGANSYVVKPVVLSEFIESVKHTGHFWTEVNHPPSASVTTM